VVFKRRTKRSYARIVAESFWPRGGWTRAFHYVKHRLRRLPDSPQRIARGVFAGVFVCFTPLFGLHFIAAAAVAFVLNGNILAALLATFFGNPITFPIIALMSLQIGHWLLGSTFEHGNQGALADTFIGAWRDLKGNVIAVFSDRPAHWDHLAEFFREVFLPYLVGGIVPGLIAGLVAYYLSEPVIAAYQKRRKKKLHERFLALREKLHRKLNKDGAE
jgi:uncharacterized protein (DUF2062 family)